MCTFMRTVGKFMPVTVAVVFAAVAQGGNPQRPVPVVERMSALPEPLEVRDWTLVARQYYARVFDPAASGSGFPAVQVDTTNGTFRVKSYLDVETSQESMICLGGVLGMRLLGLDVRAWHGFDFAQACKAWFDPDIGFYRHVPGQRGGEVHGDIYGYWPAIQGMLFAAFWPEDKDFARHRDAAILSFDAVARGCGCPDKPDFDVLGWDFIKGAPSGRQEPMNRLSHAPTVAWALMVGAGLRQDAAMAERARAALRWQFAQNRGRYEMTFLPVAITAVRLNRLPGGSQRPLDLDAAMKVWFGDYPEGITTWAITAGTRCGGITCDGLDGARWDKNGFYAFTMGSLQAPAWLVPVARYEPRYARAIAKYALHAANSARLLQGQGLSDGQQDHGVWKRANDPERLLFYEGLKSCSPDPAGRYTPYATGDPMLLGWGHGRKVIPNAEYLARRDAEFADGCGNIALYMGNQIGFLGGILRLTNVPGVLAWDCLATDWYHEAAWPTTLVYNPHAQARAVELPLRGDEVFYDAASGVRVMTERASDLAVRVTLAPDTACVLVRVPGKAAVVRQPDGRLAADGRVIVFGASATGKP